MAEITLSNAVRNNLLSLQNTADLLGKTQQRLSTGLKVNSALDDPTAFFTASSLNSRASDLNRLLDSVGNAVQTVRAADNGLSAITKLVESAQASARQALQKPLAVSTAAAAATTAGSVLFAADDTAAVATATGGGLALDTAATTVGTAVAAVNDTAAVATGTDIGADSQNVGSVLGINDGDELIVTVDGNSTTLQFDIGNDGDDGGGGTLIAVNDSTIDALITELNGIFGTGGSNEATVTNAGSASNAQIQFANIASNTGAIQLQGDAGVLAALGLDASGNQAGGSATDQTATATNAALTAETGSLDVTINSVTTNISLAAIESIGQLEAAIVAATNTEGTITSASNTIDFTATATDQDITVAIGSAVDAAATLQAIGLGNGTDTSLTFEPQNATAGLSAAVSGNEQLVFTINGNTDIVTFGTDDGSNEVSNRDELEQRLAAISGAGGNTGAAFSVSAGAGGLISASAANLSDGAITVSGGTNALSFAGFGTGVTANTTNAALTALTQSDFTVNFGGAGAETIDFSVINSVADLDTELGNLVNGTGARDASGAITFTGANTTDTITIGGTDTGTGFTSGAVTNPTPAGTTNNADRTALEAEFNNLRDQIDQLAADASFNGINLLNGDNLQVIFNENGTSSLSVTGVTFDSAGLGISTAATDSFQANTAINASLSELDTAIGTLRQQASTFGSQLSVVEVRQDFTKNLINTLETGAANLTLADTNEEGANLLALQTRQQLSSVALSLASQADQNVLRLF